MYVPIHIECLDSISMVVSIIGDISTVRCLLLKIPQKRPITFKGVYSTGDMITMSCIRRSDVIDLEN